MNKNLEMENMPTVQLASIRKMVDKLKDHEDTTELSLEFVLVALFPNVWKNIQKYGNDCYTRGYIRGLKENEN